MDLGLLERLVLTVEDFLESINVKVPFFVAGGSVYSIINGRNHYDDIDVFFYNREDCDAVVSKLDVSDGLVMTIGEEAPIVSTKPSAFVTSNAVTVTSLAKSILQRQIQFVKLHVGDVHEIFSKFDLNCSKVAFTSDRKFVKSADYTKHISVDEKNINGMILNRYYKYQAKKCCEDVDRGTLKQIIRFLVNNYDETFDTGYTNEPDIHGYTLIDNCISTSATEYSYNVAQYAHDFILTKDNHTRIDIYSKSKTFLNAKIDNMCDELYLQLMLRAIDHPKVYICKERPEVKEKYAEYFI